MPANNPEPAGFVPGADVSAAEAIAAVRAGSAWLLDVREDNEWDAGHAPGAHHIPMQEIAARQDELPSQLPILAACHVGVRSRMVTDALVGAGYPAVNLAGGMAAWQECGGDVRTADGAPGRII
ncbi:MAG: rhodanese-like domain-containing protein [Microbacteriaceae bacterium]